MKIVFYENQDSTVVNFDNDDSVSHFSQVKKQKSIWGALSSRDERFHLEMEISSPHRIVLLKVSDF